MCWPVQVVIADHFEEGPFIELWQRLSNPHPVIALNHPSLNGRLACFTHSTFAHYVGPDKAFLGYEGVGSEHTCPSTLLMAAAHWQRYLFKELLPVQERKEYEAFEHAVQQAVHHDQLHTESILPTVPYLHATGTTISSSFDQPHRRLNVLWLSRTWFSRSMKAGGGLTGWQASRDMSPQQEQNIVVALEKAVLDWNDKACAPPVFGWWQQPHKMAPQTGCTITNVTFDFRVSCAWFWSYCSGLQCSCLTFYRGGLQLGTISKFDHNKGRQGRSKGVEEPLLAASQSVGLRLAAQRHEQQKCPKGDRLNKRWYCMQKTRPRLFESCKILTLVTLFRVASAACPRLLYTASWPIPQKRYFRQRARALVVPCFKSSIS
jgi:hypothetical protein